MAVVVVETVDTGDGISDGVIGNGEGNDPAVLVKDVAEHGDNNAGAILITLRFT